MEKYIIQKATYEDLQKILDLQYLAYQSEAELFGSRDIPPLKQTLEEIICEYEQGIILKTEEEGSIIGSVRAVQKGNTVYIGKLMVHPDFRRRGIGRKLLLDAERYFPKMRYELFTSTRSSNNIRLYESLGYVPFRKKAFNQEITFVYMEKAAQSDLYCSPN